MARTSTTSVTQPSVKAFLVCYKISKERKRGRWICRTWKWRTKKDQRLENAGPGNGGPNRRAGKCRTWKMTDHITVLVLENTYFYHGENSFTGALSSRFSSIEIRFVWCSQTLNITFRRGS